MMPFMTGIFKSIKTRSGCVTGIFSRASLPSFAVPTTVISGSEARIRCRPSHTISWSSQIRTLIKVLLPDEMNGRSHSRLRIDLEFGAYGRSPLLHAAQPEPVVFIDRGRVETMPVILDGEVERVVHKSQLDLC